MASILQIDTVYAARAKRNANALPEARRNASLYNLRRDTGAETLVLAHESSERFLALRLGYISKFEPADYVERDLVEQMIAAKWRQLRAWQMESSLFGKDAGEALAPAAITAKLDALAAIQRYEQGATKQYFSAMDALLELRVGSMRPPLPQAAANPKLFLVPAPTNSKAARPEPTASQPCTPTSDAANQPGSRSGRIANIAEPLRTTTPETHRTHGVLRECYGRFVRRRTER
jgi:hypothetical protein